MSEDRMIPIKKSDNSHYTIDEIGSIEFGFFNPENLQLLFKSAAIGMPLAVLIGFFPQAMKGLLEDLPNLFADRKELTNLKTQSDKLSNSIKKIEGDVAKLQSTLQPKIQRAERQKAKLQQQQANVIRKQQSIQDKA